MIWANCLQNDVDIIGADSEDVTTDGDDDSVSGTNEGVAKYDNVGGNNSMATPVTSGVVSGGASQEQTNRKRETKKAANVRATLNWMDRDENAPNTDAAKYEVE